MVWNKTPEATEKRIIQELQDIKMSYQDIAAKLEVSNWIVGDIARRLLPKDLKKIRYSYHCSKSKHGSDNPMFGRTRDNHPNHSDGDVFVIGYKTEWAPDWWQGLIVKSGRVYQHQRVWAESLNQTCVPKGCVIHHIDLNKLNNSAENLQLLTISEHMRLHAEIRKVQRLERNLVGSK